MNNEELNKAIEEAARKLKYKLNQEMFAAGALTALTTESIYSKARLVKEEWVIGKPEFDREMMFVSAKDVNGGYVYRMWNVEWITIDGEKKLILCDESREYWGDFDDLHIDMYKEVLPAPPKQ